MEITAHLSGKTDIPVIKQLCLAVLYVYALVAFFPVNVAAGYITFALAPAVGIFAMLVMNKKLRIDRWTAEVYIMLTCWLIYALIGILWALNPKLVLEDSLKIFRFLLTFIIFSQLLRRPEYQKYIASFFQLVFIGYICIYIYEMKTGNHMPSSRLYEVALPFPTGPYYNENNSALYLLLMSPFLAVKTRLTSTRIGKLVALGLFMAMIASAAIQTSRLALAIMVLLGVYYFIFYVSNFIRIAAAAMVVLAFMVFVTFFNSEYKLAQILLKSQIATIQNEKKSYFPTSTSIRSHLSMHSINMSWKNGFAGVGGGNYEEYMSRVRFHDTAWVLNAHNYWLEMFANYGIVVLLGMVYLYLKWLIRLWQLRTRCPREEYEKYNAFFISFLMFIPLSLIPSSIRIYYSVWLYMAMIHAVCLNDVHPTEADESTAVLSANPTNKDFVIG